MISKKQDNFVQRMLARQRIHARLGVDVVGVRLSPRVVLEYLRIVVSRLDSLRIAVIVLAVEVGLAFVRLKLEQELSLPLACVSMLVACFAFTIWVVFF